MILKTDENGNFVLPATAVLSGLSEQLVSSHRDLMLRHPLGVYNTSIAVIAKRVDRVLSLLRVVVPEADSGDAGSPEEHVDELLESQEALLHGLMQHMDDCINILRGFTVERRTFDKNHVKVYRRAVQEYRDHIGKVVGRIKHGQGRLCLLTVELEPISFAGYFVAVGLADGSVGPDPNIHKDGKTAFSFNRDLRYHLCHILLASGHLATAVEGLTAGGGSSGATPAGEPGTTDSVLSVSDLAETYFPDEYKKPRPVLRLETPQDRPRRLIVEFVSPKTWRPFAGPRFKITLRVSGDGITRSLKAPYLFRS